MCVCVCVCVCVCGWVGGWVGVCKDVAIVRGVLQLLVTRIFVLDL